MGIFAYELKMSAYNGCLTAQLGGQPPPPHTHTVLGLLQGPPRDRGRHLYQKPPQLAPLNAEEQRRGGNKFQFPPVDLLLSSTVQAISYNATYFSFINTVHPHSSVTSTYSTFAQVIFLKHCYKYTTSAQHNY